MNYLLSKFGDEECMHVWFIIELECEQMLVQAAECNVHSNVKCTRIYVSCASIVPGQQIHNNESLSRIVAI